LLGPKMVRGSARALYIQWVTFDPKEGRRWYLTGDLKASDSIYSVVGHMRTLPAANNP
jgi:hypothetical protein